MFHNKMEELLSQLPKQVVPSHIKTMEVHSEIADPTRKTRNIPQSLRQYRKYEKLLKELKEHMIDFFFSNDPKYIAYLSENIKHISSSSNLQKTTVALDTTDDIGWYADMMIYPKKGEHCLCSYYLETKKARSADKVELINAMLNSSLSLYKIIALNPETGTITLEDCFGNGKVVVYDEAIAQQPKYLNWHMMERIIEVQDLKFLSGLHFMYQLNYLNRWIKKRKNRRFTYPMANELYELLKKQ